MRKSFTIDHLLEHTVDSDVITLTLFESELSFVVDGEARVPFAVEYNFTVEQQTKMAIDVTELFVPDENFKRKLTGNQGEAVMTVLRPNLEDLSNSVEAKMLITANDGLKIDIPDAYLEAKKPTFFWG